MFVTLRNHLITYMYSYKILRLVQIKIEKSWREYSNEAERGTGRGMRYMCTLIALKIHLLTGEDVYSLLLVGGINSYPVRNEDY